MVQNRSMDLLQRGKNVFDDHLPEQPVAHASWYPLDIARIEIQNI